MASMVFIQYIYTEITYTYIFLKIPLLFKKQLIVRFCVVQVVKECENKFLKTQILLQ